MAVVVPSLMPGCVDEELCPLGVALPELPPPRVIFPPPESLSPVRPLAELSTTSSPIRIGPPALLSLFDQKVMSPLLVRKVREGTTSTLPRPLIRTSAPDRVEVMFSRRVRSPP